MNERSPGRGTPRPGLLEPVASYYSARVSRYGATPLGVDWTCVPTQQLRFVQLLKVIDAGTRFTVHEIGCGYGALLEFMRTRWLARDFSYVGTDISPAMIDAANERHALRRNARFEVAQGPMPPADYTLASGVFNVKLSAGRNAWQRYVERSVAEIAHASRKGFAVNFIESMRNVGVPAELYRTTPGRWVHLCEAELGFDVQVLQGYGLREFTLWAIRR